MTQTLIDLADFNQAAKTFQQNDEFREELIKNVRNFQRNAKTAITHTHKSNSKKAASTLKQSLDQGHKVIQEILPKLHRLRFENSFVYAVEEYLEALIYLELKKCCEVYFAETESESELVKFKEPFPLNKNVA